MQKINEFILNGFHYDANLSLEKSGIYKPINKVYGNPKYNAQECYKAQLDFGNDIICNDLKTFFPAHWSQEKIIQTIFGAAQNRIEKMDFPHKNSFKFLCKSDTGLLIEIIVNNKNIIKSAYPSERNFNQ